MAAAGRLVHDVKDAHIVALALSQSADQIVTSNTKDYKSVELGQHEIAVVTPDDFLVQLYCEIPDEVIVAIESQVAGSGVYPATTHDILSLLHRSGCPRFAAMVCIELDLLAPDPQRHR